MEVAYVFGTLGNLADCLGSGWSVEEAFAWTVGTTESELTLPLPGDDLRYVLRFDVRPALFLPDVASQRLTMRTGVVKLATFEMKARQTISVALPPAVTRGRRQITLTFLHPDAARPADHGPDDDTRLLGFCFHSASLAQDGAEAAVQEGSAAALAPAVGLIAGGETARLVCQVINRLPCLKGRIGIHFLDLARPSERAAADLPAGALETIRFCWTEMNIGAVATGESPAKMLPPDCRTRAFYVPACEALWPFRGHDGRAVPEPGRYPASRYPYGDRLAQALAGVEISSDMLLLMYEAATGKEPIDLDAMFAADLRLWQRQDEQSGLRLADFIARRFRQDRLFVAPDRVGPVLLRELVRQLLDDPLVNDLAAPAVVARELDLVLDGYAGVREEVPVHPRVAAHFGLSWWSLDMRYRWMNNLLSQRDYVLDVIKWTPWRP